MEKITELIEEKKFAAAIEYLDNLPKNLDYFRYKGLIAYLQEDYHEAISCLEQAKGLEDSDEQWNDLLESAEANAYAQVSTFVPEKTYPDKQQLHLLYLEAVSADYSEAPTIPQKFSPLQLINNAVGNFLGRAFSVLLEIITEVWGRIGGYRDAIWTNWYRKHMFWGVLSLAYMRNQLNRNNLFSTYSPQEKELYKNLLGKAPNGALHFRTANGTFNNPDNPIEGATGTRFQRNVDHESSNSMDANSLMHPNPRELSRTFLTRKSGMLEAPFLNMLAAAWIQFQNHDWISHGEPLTHQMHEINILPDDPIYKMFHQRKMFVGKTPSDPTRTEDSPYRYTFVNEVTHWWDGSQIYGSDEETVRGLRAFRDGKLRLTEAKHLPLDQKGIEQTGFTRNWWVGLSLFHTLFAREHNAICDHLQTLYPSWSDDQFYHVARLVNSALMAKIHTLEWNGAVNPNQMIYNGNHSNWYGFLTTLLRKKKNWRTVAHINIRNTELGGVVGNPTKRYNADFGLTQEFVEAYRIHSMLPEKLQIRNIDQPHSLEEVPFVKSRQSGSAQFVNQYGIDNLWYSMANQHPGQVVLNNYPRFMQELSIPGNPIYDMGAVDILRSRERGVPRYNEFRRQLGLTPLEKFEDLTSDAEAIRSLKQFYGEDKNAIEDLDFMIGTLAEEFRPSGFAFGETMFQLFLLNATRRLQADRFYTSCYTPKYYTAEGMRWIDNNDLKSVLLRHYPRLAATGLSNVRNAFEPWDEDEYLDADRHPLRAFDKTLKDDPWHGENYRKN